jgi:hypothetical protein
VEGILGSSWQFLDVTRNTTPAAVERRVDAQSAAYFRLEGQRLGAATTILGDLSTGVLLPFWAFTLAVFVNDWERGKAAYDNAEKDGAGFFSKWYQTIGLMVLDTFNITAFQDRDPLTGEELDPTERTIRRIGAILQIIAAGLEAVRLLDRFNKWRTTPTPAPKGALEGRRAVEVTNPKTGNVITDIDEIKGGVLWEEKSAIFATDNAKWVEKHITKKFNAYLEARKNLPGYENAPIGFKFTAGKPVDPALEKAIIDEISRLRKANPGVDIRLEW